MPTVSGSCLFSAIPYELIVTGSTALVAAKRHGLYMFDVSKPAAPRLFKRYDFSWSPVDISVTGNRVTFVAIYFMARDSTGNPGNQPAL